VELFQSVFETWGRRKVTEKSTGSSALESIASRHRNLCDPTMYAVPFDLQRMWTRFHQFPAAAVNSATCHMLITLLRQCMLIQSAEMKRQQTRFTKFYVNINKSRLSKCDGDDERTSIIYSGRQCWVSCEDITVEGRASTACWLGDNATPAYM